MNDIVRQLKEERLNRAIARGARGDNTPPEGMFFNPNTGQYTSRELLGNALKPSIGRGAAVSLGAADGMTLGGADELYGGARGGADDEARHYFTESWRAKQEAAREKYPGSYLTGQVGGAAATLAVPVGQATTTAGVVGRAAAGGTIAGATDALLSAEGTPQERAGSVPVGAALGLAGGVVAVPFAAGINAVGRKFGPRVSRIFQNRRYVDGNGQLTEAGRAALTAIGVKAEEVTETFLDAFQKRAARAADIQEAGRVAELDQFGIPAFRANVTGAPNDFADMDRLAKIGDGAAGKRMRDALDAQERAMREAGEDVARGMSPPGVVGDQGDAAVAISNRLRQTAEVEERLAKDLYDRSKAAGVRLDPGIASGVASRIETRLTDEEVFIDLDAFPQARSFMERLKRRGERDEGVSLQLVDGLRKDLNRALTRTGEGTEDYRALSIIKEEYDQWFEDVVEAKLFSSNVANPSNLPGTGRGASDPQGIQDLQEARRLFAEYAKRFRGNDKGSKFIQQMIDADASPDDVTKWLFSAGRLGSGRFTSVMAGALKRELGEDSAEWGLLKQAAIKQLIQRPLDARQWGPQKISENIFNFFRSPATRELSRTIFSPEEVKQVLAYGNALKRMVPPDRSINYSGSGLEVGRQVKQAATALAATLGFKVGGAPGAAAGAGAVNLTGRGSQWLQSRAALSGPRVASGTPTTAAAMATVGASEAQPITEWFLGLEE